MQDEMIFTALISSIIIIMIVIISLIFNNFMNDIESNFGDYFVFQTIIFLKAEPGVLENFCPNAVDKLLSI